MQSKDSDYSDDEIFDDEEMGLFVKKYNWYVWKNGIKHFDNNLIKFRRQSSSVKENNNKKEKERLFSTNVINLVTTNWIVHLLPKERKRPKK